MQRDFLWWRKSRCFCLSKRTLCHEI